jgi:hypothetical protein
VSEHKTVEGMNRLFVLDVRNQSRLKRLLTESRFSPEALKAARLALLGSLAGPQLKPKGVLSLEDTLLTHSGQHVDKIAYLDDSTQGRDGWAHTLVNRHDSDEQTDYPVAFRLGEPAALDALAAGLKAAGVPLRDSQAARKQDAPPKWRQSLLGVWRRQQHEPTVQAL